MYKFFSFSVAYHLYFYILKTFLKEGAQGAWRRGGGALGEGEGSRWGRSLRSLTRELCDAPAADVAVGEGLGRQVLVRQAGGLDVVVALDRLVQLDQGDVVEVESAVVVLVVHQPFDGARLGIGAGLGALGGPDLDPPVLHLEIPAGPRGCYQGSSGCSPLPGPLGWRGWAGGCHSLEMSPGVQSASHKTHQSWEQRPANKRKD